MIEFKRKKILKNIKSDVIHIINLIITSNYLNTLNHI